LTEFARRKLGRALGYGWPGLVGDLSGGIIAALIALPYGLAMASLMGLPPVLGVFTSILTAPIIALLGRNPVLIGGTASVTVPIIALAVKNQGVGGAAKVSIVASVIMMAFCVVRLGRHIARVPHAVVTGFSCGIGGMMLVSQLDVILGVDSAATRSAGSTVAQLAVLAERLGGVRPAPLVLGALVMVVATLVARWSPRAPAPLFGVAMAIIAARFLAFHEREIGAMSWELPPFVGFSWNPKDVLTVLPAAFGLAFVSSVNILMTSRVVEHFRGRHKRAKTSDADAELGAYGIANICAAMFGAPLSVGIPARSLAVVRCGGTTRVANLVHAVVLGVILWVGSGVVSHIPLPALAGVTAWMGLCLLDWSAWRRLPKMSRTDAAAFLATAVSVLAVGNAVMAVAIGCSVYGLKYVYVRWVRPESRVPDLQMD
jgi:SulP family sulfate permease